MLFYSPVAHMYSVRENSNTFFLGLLQVVKGGPGTSRNVSWPPDPQNFILQFNILSSVGLDSFLL